MLVNKLFKITYLYLYVKFYLIIFLFLNHVL